MGYLLDWNEKMHAPSHLTLMTTILGLTVYSKDNKEQPGERTVCHQHVAFFYGRPCLIIDSMSMSDN